METEPSFVYLLYYQRPEGEYGETHHSLVGVFDSIDRAAAWVAAAKPYLIDEPLPEYPRHIDGLAAGWDLGPPWSVIRRRLNLPLPADERYVTGSCLFGWVMRDEGDRGD